MNGPYIRMRDGILREEGYYVDGMRNGPFVEYYQDGVVHRKDTPMKAGKIDGKVTTYYSDGKVESKKNIVRVSNMESNVATAKLPEKC